MNFHWRLLGLALAATALPLSADTAPAPQNRIPPAASHAVSFRTEIQPILEASCLNCHGRGRAKGGFRLDTRESTLEGGDSGSAVVLRKSEESPLIQLVAGVDPDNVMPLKGKRLTEAQVGLLRAWIDQGLPWDADVSFAKVEPVNLTPREPKLQPIETSSLNPVDQILAGYYSQTEFEPPKPVSDRVFARRAYLDTVGLLPSPTEMDRFLKERSSDRRQLLVRGLLNDNERYAQHWLSFWNDLLRNDYRGTGYIDGGRKQITSWLYSALLTNMPYDQFTAALVNPRPEAEGFIKGIIWRGVVNSSQTPQMQAAQNVSQVFMGVNIKCASCHDSFINQWRLSDAYGLAAVYNESPLEMFQCDKPTGQMAAPSFIYPQLGNIDPQADRTTRLAKLAEIMTSAQNGRLSRTIVNRLWGHFFGRALVEPRDDMEQAAWNPDLLDWLAEDLVRNRYNLKRTMEVILTSQAYQLPSVDVAPQGKGAYTFQGPGVRRLSAEQFRDAIGQLTDVWQEHSSIPAVTNNVRSSLAPADLLAIAMGRPNREQVVTTRANEATTLQALELTNGETLASILERGAATLASTHVDGAGLVENLYARALGRLPSPLERQTAAELAGQPLEADGLEDLLWSIAMLPEFQLIY